MPYGRGQTFGPAPAAGQQGFLASESYPDVLAGQGYRWGIAMRYSRSNPCLMAIVPSGKRLVKPHFGRSVLLGIARQADGGALRLPRVCPQLTLCHLVYGSTSMKQSWMSRGVIRMTATQSPGRALNPVPYVIASVAILPARPPGFVSVSRSR